MSRPMFYLACAHLLMCVAFTFADFAEARWLWFGFGLMSAADLMREADARRHRAFMKSILPGHVLSGRAQR